MAATTVGVLVLYGAYLMHGASRPPQGGRPLTAGFAGSASCAGCHADLHARHAHSSHARALRAAGDPSVLDQLPNPKPQDDPDTGARHRIAVAGNAPAAEATLAGVLYRTPLSWAFGSGSQGMTLVGQRADGRWVEAPQSFYRSAGWDFTVGFLGNPARLRPENAAGVPLEPEDAFACFHCHTAGLARGPNGPDLAGMQPGVQCESCHGPGRSHVEAARRNAPLAGTLPPPRRPGQGVVTFCATCHRDSPPPGLKLTDPVIARFAPIGFQQSACFRENRDSFSCITCHDPHGSTPRDPAHFRSVCTGCHASQGPERCPVQPVGNCVSCHMPKRIVQRHSLFTDHWIRVYREESGTGAAADRDLHKQGGRRP